MRIDPGVVVLSVNSRDVIERVVVNHREAQKSFIENIGRADRLPIIVQRRIWLPPVEGAGLRRVRRSRRVGRDQIWITGHTIITGLATEGIRMHCDVAAPAIEQHRPVDAIVH